MIYVSNASEVIPALANGYGIAFLKGGESGRAMRRQVGVALLKTVVLANVVEVVTTNDNGALHLGGDDSSTEDTAANGNVSNEGALLVNVVTSRSGLRGLEAQTNRANKTGNAGSTLLANKSLGAKENSGLLLESLLVL